MIETFGIDTIKEGYYGYNLQQSLTNKVVETTGRNHEEVDVEIFNLLNDMNHILLEIHKEEYTTDDLYNLRNLYVSICERLGVYYEQINNKKIEDNQIVQLVSDWILDEHNSTVYNKENEKVVDLISFDLNSGEAVFKLEIPGKELSRLNEFLGKSTVREITLNDLNKYEGNLDINETFSR
ncbi:MAG: hypothetical protein IKF17_03875 [Clostridia bacterium]|nr:hypothetical protein [Clostridia bacterium]